MLAAQPPEPNYTLPKVGPSTRTRARFAGDAAPDLSIIIVNWNTRELLAGCLGSIADCELGIADDRTSAAPIYHSTNLPVTEVFVVDNASTDGSAAMVRERFPWVRLIESPDNLGFAAGNNLALRHAAGQYLLLLNPDTVVTQGAIERLWQVLAAQPTAGIAGAQLLNADGSPQTSIGVYPSLWSELPLLNRRLSPVRKTEQVSTTAGNLSVLSVAWVSGACLMIKREVVETIGPLDESFWLYTEETDWCYRARSAGWDVLLVPQAQTYHLARAASRQRCVVTMLHFYQSRIRFVCKHHGRRQGDMVRHVYWLKARAWQARPERSPLATAYADLSASEIRTAYRQLQQAMSLPLGSLLSANWQ